MKEEIETIIDVIKCEKEINKHLKETGELKLKQLLDSHTLTLHKLHEESFEMFQKCREDEKLKTSAYLETLAYECIYLQNALLKIHGIELPEVKDDNLQS